MYYDEQVINGVLCHRGTPQGEWIPFTLEALSISLVAMRRQVKDRDERIAKLTSLLSSLKKILNEN